MGLWTYQDSIFRFIRITVFFICNCLCFCLYKRNIFRWNRDVIRIIFISKTFCRNSWWLKNRKMESAWSFQKQRKNLLPDDKQMYAAERQKLFNLNTGNKCSWRNATCKSQKQCITLAVKTWNIKPFQQQKSGQNKTFLKGK